MRTAATSYLSTANSTDCCKVTNPQPSFYTHQINDDVFAKSRSPLSSHLAHVGHSLWVISVDVEDGSIDHTCHICAVRGWPRHAWISCEANLEHSQLLHHALKRASTEHTVGWTTSSASTRECIHVDVIPPLQLEKCHPQLGEILSI